MQEENNFYKSGWNKVKQKDYAGANADFLKAFQAAEKESAEKFLAFFSRGCVEIYLKQYDKTLKTFDAVVKWHEQRKIPENAEYGRAFFNRGLAYVGLGKNEDAIKDFYTALDYGSGAASYGEKAWKELNKLGEFHMDSPPVQVTAAKVVAKSLPNAWGGANSNAREAVKKAAVKNGSSGPKLKK